MSRIPQISLASFCLIILFGSPSLAESPSILLEKAIYQEETVGDLDSAIEIYLKVVEQDNKAGKCAAQACYRLGKCYLKKNQHELAVDAFKKIIDQYPNDKTLIERAKEQLALLNGPADSRVSKRMINRKVSDFPEESASTSPEATAAAQLLAKSNVDFDTFREQNPSPVIDENSEYLRRKYERFQRAAINAEIIEVLTYKEDLAYVIAYLPFTKNSGEDPYWVRSFGKIDQRWRSIKGGPFPNLEQAERNFENNKDLIWDDYLLFREVDRLNRKDPKTLTPYEVATQYLLEIDKDTLFPKFVQPPRKLASVHANDKTAMAITSEADWSEGGRAPLVFYLKRDHNKWEYDKSLRKTPSDAVQIQLYEFLRQNPDTIEVLPADIDETQLLYRKFAALVLGDDRITFQGKEVQWDELPSLLKQLPDKQSTVLEVGIAGEVSAKRLMQALGLADKYNLEYGSYIGEAKLGTMGSPARQITVAEQAASSFSASLKFKLVNLVENFFERNYRDITARKTLEWGEPEIAATGNYSIAYKYLATFWHKEKMIVEQVFTFSPEGKYISAKTVNKKPACNTASDEALAVAETFVSALRAKDLERSLRLLSEDFTGNKSDIGHMCQYWDLSNTNLVKILTTDDITRAAFGTAISAIEQKRFFLYLELVRDKTNNKLWSIRNVGSIQDNKGADRKWVIDYVENVRPGESTEKSTATAEAVTVGENFVTALRNKTTDLALQLLSDDFDGTRSEIPQFAMLMDFSKTELLAARTKGGITRLAFTPATIIANGKQFFLTMELARENDTADSWRIRSASFCEDEDADDRKTVIGYVTELGE